MINKTYIFCKEILVDLSREFLYTDKLNTKEFIILILFFSTLIILGIYGIMKLKRKIKKFDWNILNYKIKFNKMGAIGILSGLCSALIVYYLKYENPPLILFLIVIFFMFSLSLKIKKERPKEYF